MASFKLDVDGDGIALVTWDMADRSMNERSVRSALSSPRSF